MTKWAGLEEFVAIAETGSFSQAAKVLNVSNSYVSRALARLEKRLQTRLVNRTTRNVVLTSSGSELIGPLKKLVEDRDTALSSVAVNGVPKGELKITCPSSIVHDFLMPVIRQYVRDFIGLSVNIEVTSRRVDLIGEGVDIAIQAGALPDSSLVAIKLGPMQLITCSSPGYYRKFGFPTIIDDLVNHNCLLGVFENWFFKDGVIFAPKGNFRSNSDVENIVSALEGMGICQVPEYLARPHLKRGELIEVLGVYRPDPAPIWAIYPHRNHLQPKLKKLLCVLGASIRKAQG